MSEDDTETRQTPEPPPTPAPRPTPAPSVVPARDQVPPQTRQEILRLHQEGYGMRRIAPRVGRCRKVVRQVLDEEGVSHPPPPQPSKLLPFRDLIGDKVKKRLTTSRILREIREAGYQGGRSILSQLVRRLRAELTLEPTKPVKRRFETRPGQEMQIDWSLYIVPIAGRPTRVHALGCILCYSRKLSLRFYRDERQATLLEGLASAFDYFEGVALRLVLDNMATAVLGRIGAEHKPLWHQRFLDFTAHYGTSPFACAVRDPDRKGKDEKAFRLVFDDLLKGAEFESWDDLARRAALWLDQTPGAGNLRLHGTTRRVPNEAWLEEKDFLIRLPAERFPVHEPSVRVVDGDSTLSVRGTRYTVPTALAGRSVAVRLFAEHFEILDAQGRIAYSRRYVAEADKGKLIIDPTHYASVPRRSRRGGGNGERLDEAFLLRFPDLRPLVDGLKLRFKTLAPIHLRALLRLCDRFGQEAFVAAATRVQQYRRFDALAVERILEREHPLEPTGSEAPPLGGVGPAVLGEVEPGSLDGYGHLDEGPPSPSAGGGDPEDPEDDHGA
jgi:transposase